ncbi:hypothetical protein J7K25_00875 [bacterium]|nr:hypothetical protein [bacterium]
MAQIVVKATTNDGYGVKNVSTVISGQYRAVEKNITVADSINDTGESIKIGADNYVHPNVDFYIGFLYFDTSGIGSGAIIQSVVLSILMKDGNVAGLSVPWYLYLGNGQPDYPHIPLATEDYGFSQYGNLLQIADARNLVVGTNNILLPESALGWINKTGITKFALFCGVDDETLFKCCYSDEYPRWIEIWSRDKGEDWAAYLTINYTEGAEKRVFIRPDGCQKGDLFYHDGEKLVRLPKGNPGQTLTVGTDGTPEWQ